MQYPPVELFMMAGQSPLFGELMAAAYARLGEHGIAYDLRQMAELGRRASKPSAQIIQFPP